jgi:hypothetical protein
VQKGMVAVLACAEEMEYGRCSASEWANGAGRIWMRQRTTVGGPDAEIMEMMQLKCRE